MINKKNKKNTNTNLEYKNKYLKYKNKYVKLTGGISDSATTVIIVSLLVSLLGLGGYVLYDQLNSSDNDDDSINNIGNNIQFIKDFEQLINSSNSMTNFMNKYFVYSNIDLVSIIEEFNKNTKDNKNTMKTLLLNYLLKNNLYSPMKLVNINDITDSREYSDTFILCLEQIFKKSDKNKNYNTIKNELLKYIEENKSFDKFFEYDKNKLSNIGLSDMTSFSSFAFANRNSSNNSDNNSNTFSKLKKEYIDYMKKESNNSVSDFPMIKAAAEKYGKHIIVKVELSNVKYLKVFRPNETSKNINIRPSDIIILDYVNMCDYNCDFLKIINTNIEKKEFYKDKNIKEKKYFNLNIDDLYEISNLKNIDIDKDEKNTKKNKLEITHKEYNNKKIFDSPQILNVNNLIHYEKAAINKKLAKRPYFQYYKFYTPKDKEILSKYYNEHIKNK